MKLALLSIFLALPVVAQGPDLKRNQRLQKLSASVVKAQADLAAELRSWTADCEAKGMTIGQVGANLIDCTPKQQTQAAVAQAPGRGPRPSPPKPEETPEQKGPQK